MKYDKINIDRKPLSAEDVSTSMDFDSMVRGKSSSGIPNSSPKGISMLVKWGVAALVVAGIAFGSHTWLNSVSEPDAVAVMDTHEDPVSVSPRKVQAPIENADNSYQSFIHNCGEDQIIAFGKSRIIIPAGSIVDLQGNNVQGKVDILYREFHTISEILLSGIPMDYDSVGNKYHFESAGMFDIRGEQNGEPVFINPEKPIEVKLSSRDDRDGFNQYYFDEKTGEWMFTGCDDPVVEQEQVEEQGSNSIEGETAEESSSFVDQDQLDAYTEGESFSNPEIRTIQEEVIILKAEKKAIIKEEPILPAKASGAHQIEISAEPEFFPELDAYENVTFEVAEGAEFDPAQSNHVWNDVKIRRGAEEGEFLITFSRPGDRYIVRCIPVLAGAKYEAAEQKFNDLFNEYEDRLDQKEAEIAEKEAELKAEKARWEKEQKEWARAQKEAQAKAQQVGRVISKTFRYFQVRNFGIWNCDSPQQYPKGAEVLAQYVDESGERIYPQQMHLVEKNRNVMFQIWGSAPLKFNPKKDNVLIGVTADAKLVIADQDEFARIDTDMSNCEMTLTVFDVEGTNEISEIIDSYTTSLN